MSCTRLCWALGACLLVGGVRPGPSIIDRQDDNLDRWNQLSTNYFAQLIFQC